MGIKVVKERGYSIAFLPWVVDPLIIACGDRDGRVGFLSFPVSLLFSVWFVGCFFLSRKS